MQHARNLAEQSGQLLELRTRSSLGLALLGNRGDELRATRRRRPAREWLPCARLRNAALTARRATSSLARGVRRDLAELDAMGRHLAACLFETDAGSLRTRQDRAELPLVAHDRAEQRAHEPWIPIGHAASVDAVQRIPQSGPLSFGYPRSDTHTHQGVDIAAPAGTLLHAIAPGRVTHASAELEPGFSGYGGHVVIESAGGHWLYGHLQSVAVQPGELVRQGQPIGQVGDTCFSWEDPAARCKGPHVHLELSPRPYPQDSEAPRLDPVPSIEAAGGVGVLFSPASSARPRALGWALLLLAGAGAGAVLLARGRNR